MIINMSAIERLGYQVQVQIDDRWDECMIVTGTHAPSESIRDAVRGIAKHRVLSEIQSEQLLADIHVSLTQIDVAYCTR